MPYVLPVLSIALQLFLLVLLLKAGSFRRFLVLATYVAVRVGTEVLQWIVLVTTGVHSDLYRSLYWTGDLTLSVLLFLLVIAMIYDVVQNSRMKPIIGKLLFGILAGVAILPFLLYHPYFSGRWFRQTGQLLNLGAAVLNLLLWTAIVGTKKRERLPLMISVAIGIEVTAAAVTYGLVQFTPSDFRWIPDLFKGLAHVLALCLWCWAFWPSRHPQSGSAAPASPSRNEPAELKL